MSSPPLYTGVATPVPGVGLGWTKVAAAVRRRVAPDAVARIWIFPPMRREGREWGTAVVAGRTRDGRFAVWTAKYMLLTRGKQRGEGRVEVHGVGTGPEEVVQDVIRGVQSRTGEGEPPIEIAPGLWFPRNDDESSSAT